MRTRLAVPAAVLAAAALLAAGCSRSRAGEPAPRVVPPPATASVPVRPLYPVPPERMPVPDPTDGVYVLQSVGGASIPAPVEGPGECAPRVVAGTLTLAESRFSYSQTMQESCGAQPATSVRRADGRFELSVSTIRLTADAGGAFASATGVFLGGSQIHLVEIAGPPEGSRRVDWHFRRQQAGAPRP